MMTTTKSKPIEFSGSVHDLAHTIGVPVDEVRASLGDLIRAGHLVPISGKTWLLRPAR
jgi:hypothetical protein